MCKKCIIAAILFLALVAGAFLYLRNEAQATAPGEIVINEIFISPAGERFIELYNTTNRDINLTGWYIQRKTAAGRSWSSLITSADFKRASSPIPANGYFLIARVGSSVAANANILIDNSMTMTADNALRLRNPNFETIDILGYGNASEHDGASAVSPQENKSLGRKSITNNNRDDFEIQQPSPGASNSTIAPKPKPELNDKQQTTSDKQQETRDRQQETSDKQQVTSDKKIEQEPQPPVSINYPTEILAGADVPFAVSFRVENLKDTTYDIKISILNAENKNISNIYNAKMKNWQSAHFYIQNAFSGTSYNGTFLKQIRDDYLNYDGNAAIVAQIRESGKNNILLKTEGNLFVKKAPKSVTADKRKLARNPNNNTRNSSQQSEAGSPQSEDLDEEVLTAEEFAAQINQPQKSNFPFVPLILGIIIALASGIGFILIKRKSSDI